MMFRLISFVSLTVVATAVAVAPEEQHDQPQHAGHVVEQILQPFHETTALFQGKEVVFPEEPFLGHYGKPPSGCEPDEKAFQISGVPGMVCSPLCDASGGCPDDMPDGVSAKPQCALENQSTGEKYCVLICNESTGVRGGVVTTGGMCGDATCQLVQPGLGICTYDI